MIRCATCRRPIEGRRRRYCDDLCRRRRRLNLGRLAHAIDVARRLTTNEKLDEDLELAGRLIDGLNSRFREDLGPRRSSSSRSPHKDPTDEAKATTPAIDRLSTSPARH